jgi:hypothetical protein
MAAGRCEGGDADGDDRHERGRPRRALRAWRGGIDLLERGER